MVRPLLDDELWKLIEPLLPPPKPRRFRYPGRKPGRLLLNHLRETDRIDLSRAVVDCGAVRAPGGAKRPVPALYIAEKAASSIT